MDDSQPEGATNRSSAKPLLLFFGSTRCGHSRRAEGFLASVLQRRGNHGTFVIRQIDADERDDLAQRFRVKELPVLFVVDGKRVAARIDRPRGAREVDEALRPWLRGTNGDRRAFRSNRGEKTH